MPPTAEPAPRPSLSAWILGHLSRVTTSNRFISQIDGLRFFAIFTVILLHLHSATHKIIDPAPKGGATGEGHMMPVAGSESVPVLMTWWGGVGVDFFFAISGFILAFPFALHYLTGSRPVKLKDYFIRRITRLEPPYILSLLVLFAAQIATHKLALSDWPHLLASVFYVHNFVYGTNSKVNGVAWSLEVEVQFYILAPLLARVFLIQSAAVRRGLMTTVILAFGYLKAAHDPWLQAHHLDLSLVSAIHRFLVGFLMADIFITTWKQRPERGSALWDLLGLIGIAMVLPGGSKPDDPLTSPLAAYAPFANADRVAIMTASSIGICLMFAAAFKGKLFAAFFSNRWIATIGGMCYTIYLFHYPIALFIMPFTKKLAHFNTFGLTYLAQTIIIFPIILVCCSIFFALVERPCMYKDWPQRLWAKFTGKPYLPPAKE